MGAGCEANPPDLVWGAAWKVRKYNALQCVQEWMAPDKYDVIIDVVTTVHMIYLPMCFQSLYNRPKISSIICGRALDNCIIQILVRLSQKVRFYSQIVMTERPSLSGHTVVAMFLSEGSLSSSQSILLLQKRLYGHRKNLTNIVNQANTTED